VCQVLRDDLSARGCLGADRRELALSSTTVLDAIDCNTVLPDGTVDDLNC
jgi:hypothetical protein